MRMDSVHDRFLVALRDNYIHSHCTHSSPLPLSEDSFHYTRVENKLPALNVKEMQTALQVIVAPKCYRGATVYATLRKCAIDRGIIGILLIGWGLPWSFSILVKKFIGYDCPKNYKISCIGFKDRLIGLPVRVSGYSRGGPEFDLRRYQIFWVAVVLEQGPLSLVKINEELLERKVAAPV
jgi:hypothetical protein